MLRKNSTLTAMIAILLMFSGCKRIDQEVATFFRTDIYASEITLKTEGYLFGGSALLDPNSNEEIRDRKITRITAGEISLSIREANLTDMLFAYQLQIKITDNVTSKSLTHNIEGINSLSVDNSFLFPDTSESDAFFSTIIKEKHGATVEITGYSSQSGVELVFNFKIAALVGLD